MKLDLTTKLYNPKGETYKTGEDDATLGEVLVNTLVGAKTDNPHRSFLLVKKLSNESAEIDIEDIVYIKHLMKDAPYIPYLVGQVIDMLN